MRTIRERANCFAALCNWIRELSKSIKELSNTANTPAIWKNDGIRELYTSIKELSNWIRVLSNSFKDKLIQLDSSLIQLESYLIQLKSAAN